MKLIRNTFAAGLVAALSLAAACSSQQVTPGTGTGSNTGSGTQPGSTLGQVSMHLQIGQGVSLTSLNYTVNGPSTVPPGTVPIGDAQSIEADIGGIPAGTGYTITLSGTDSLNDPCTGTSTSFSVQPGLVTYTTITVTCTQPADASNAADVNTGVVAIDASVNLITAVNYDCPGISAFSVSPAEISSPQTAALAVSTVQASGGSPGTETISWTASNGGFTDTGTTSSSLAAPTFACGTFVGTAVVSVTVGLTGSNNGVDAGNVCVGQPFTTYSANVVCESGTAACFSTAPTNCSGTCTNTNTDNNNCGTCGTVCTAPETCNGGTCSCASGTSLCAGACVALNTTTNCGTCGNACTAGDSCISGACVAPPPSVCTSGTCGANTIYCGNEGANAPCTSTEAIFVNLDINRGYLSTAGNAAANSNPNSCYACLVSNNCLDNPSRGFTGQECSDLSAPFTSGTSGVTLTAAAACNAVVSCVSSTTGANCVANAAGPSYCYCGTGGETDNGTVSPGGPTTCQGAGSFANGPCFASESQGFTYSPTDGTDIVKAYDTTTQPSGMANALFVCASGNGCNSCFNQ
jgi:hypothetical protein